MYYAMGHMCARCRIRVDQLRDCLGESGLYSPNRAFKLCDPCFEAAFDGGNGFLALPRHQPLHPRNDTEGTMTIPQWLVLNCGVYAWFLSWALTR